MMEVVFSDSAGGSLKAAQRCGQGEFSSAGIGVIIGHSDGREPTQEEIDAAREEAVKRMRAEWEAAVPLGGSSADVYCFSYMLSIGDISERVPGEKRRNVLEWLYDVHPYFVDSKEYIDGLIINGRNALEEVKQRIYAGESVRVWYSNQPDELCGLYWFLAQMNAHDLPNEQIFTVALPDFEARDDGTVTTHTGWGGVKAGDWHGYTDLQKTASAIFVRHCAHLWQQLQLENAALRAVLNGRLVGVPETIYDEYIIREIESAEDEFLEAKIVGKVLGKYELGIGDSWVAKRIDVMVSSGLLTPVIAPEPGRPQYHRMLKKTASFL